MRSYVLACLICLAARSKSCHGRLVVRLYTRTLEAATHTRKRHVCICKRDLDKCKRDLDKCKRDLRICKRDQQDAQQDKTCAQQARISLVKTMGVLLRAYQACTCVLLCAVLLYTCRGACLPSVHMRLVVCLHMCFHVCACCVRASSCGCLPGVRAHIHLVIVLSFCTDLLLGLARISCCVVHRSLVVSCRAQICAEKCAQHNMRSMLCSRTDLCREMCTTQHENNTTSCKTQQEISEKCAQHNMRTTQHVVLCTFRTTQQRVVHISHRFHVVFCTDLLWCLAYL